MFRSVVAVAGLFGAVQVSCAAPVPFEHHVDSEHVRLFFDPAAPPCDGSVAALERIARAQANRLGLPLGPIDYYYWPRAAESEFDAVAPCSDAQGCTIGPRIWARGLISHELVHAIEHGSRDSSAVFFDEGIAVALGESIPSSVDLATSPQLSVTRDELDQDGYAVAGDFVSFLLVRFGSDVVHELMDRIPRSAGEREIADAFVEVLGMTPAETWAARVASGQRFEGGSLNLPACAAAEPLEWQSPDGWFLAADLEDPTCATAAPPAFDIPAEGTYRIDMASGRGGIARFRSCEPGAGFGRRLGTAARQLVIADLEAGRHVLDLSTGTHDVEVAPVGSASACGAASQDVPPDVEQLIVRASQRAPLHATVRFDMDTLLAVGLDPGTTVELCTPPFASLRCARAADGDTVAVGAGEELCLRAPAGAEVGLRPLSGVP